MLDLKVKININGEEKEFRKNYLSVKSYKEVLKIVTKMRKEELEISDIIDIYTEFLVSIYQNQFSKEDVEEGMGIDSLIKTAKEHMDKITGVFNEESKN